MPGVLGNFCLSAIKCFVYILYRITQFKQCYIVNITLSVIVTDKFAHPFVELYDNVHIHVELISLHINNYKNFFDTNNQTYYWCDNKVVVNRLYSYFQL